MMLRASLAVLLTLSVAISRSVGHAAAAEPQSFTLTKRTASGPYGTSAYSFRHASQDLAVHQNFVDLVFNPCGQLHISPHGGLNSRVTDVGEMSLDDAPNEAAADATWRTRSVLPKAGHAYLQEIEDDGHKSLVKFHVDEVGADKLTITWTPIRMDVPKPQQGQGRRGAAGTMGTCGAGGHDER